jgi:hypothetical protein
MARAKPRPWTEADNAKLKSLAGTMKERAIARDHGRTLGAVVMQASELKVSLSRRRSGMNQNQRYGAISVAPFTIGEAGSVPPAFSYLWLSKAKSMNRLRKYVEWMSRGRRTNRIAYVMKEWDLPPPGPGAEWQPDTKFSPAEELLNNPDLATVFKEALEKGVAVYRASEPDPNG